MLKQVQQCWPICAGNWLVEVISICSRNVYDIPAVKASYLIFFFKTDISFVYFNLQIYGSPVNRFVHWSIGLVKFLNISKTFKMGFVIANMQGCRNLRKQYFLAAMSSSSSDNVTQSVRPSVCSSVCSSVAFFLF